MKYFSNGKAFNDYDKKISFAQKKRFVIGLIIVAASLIMVQLIYHFIVYPSLKISNIEFLSDLDTDIMNGISSNLKSSLEGVIYFNVNMEEIQKKIDATKDVKNFHIEKKFPNSIRIVLKGRKPLLRISDSQYIDEDGIVFSNNNKQKDYLPIVDMDTQKENDPGMIYFLKNLKELKEKESEYFLQISGFDFRYEQGNLKIYMYIKDFDLPFLISKNLTGDMIKYMIACKKIFSSKRAEMKRINYFDFRGNNIVYTYKD